jgi:hypothetical protein
MKRLPAGLRVQLVELYRGQDCDICGFDVILVPDDKRRVRYRFGDETKKRSPLGGGFNILLPKNFHLLSVHEQVEILREQFNSGDCRCRYVYAPNCIFEFKFNGRTEGLTEPYPRWSARSFVPVRLLV